MGKSTLSFPNNFHLPSLHVTWPELHVRKFYPVILRISLYSNEEKYLRFFDDYWVELRCQIWEGKTNLLLCSQWIITVLIARGKVAKKTGPKRTKKAGGSKKIGKRKAGGAKKGTKRTSKAAAGGSEGGAVAQSTSTKRQQRKPAKKGGKKGAASKKRTAKKWRNGESVGII